MLAVTDVSCTRCHDNAGRPFHDLYEPTMGYGELWGEDQIFSWHPFETKAFVDANGDVVSFNNDNRKIRADFAAAGLMKPYNAAIGANGDYREIPRQWSYFPWGK